MLSDCPDEAPTKCSLENENKYHYPQLETNLGVSTKY